MENTKKCPFCAEEINIEAIKCRFCGSMLDGSNIKLNKNKTTAGLLAIFLGSIGANYFYLGENGSGVICLLLCWTGIPTIIGILQGIGYLSISEENFNKKYNFIKTNTVKISENTKKCQNWWSRHPIVTFILFIFLGFIIIKWILEISNTTNNITTQNNIDSNSVNWASSQFSQWDGSHILLKRYLEKSLKDPDSLEIIETKYWENKDSNNNDYLTVNMKYRAKNSFGGYVIETIKAQFDKNGNPINTDKWETY